MKNKQIGFELRCTMNTFKRKVELIKPPELKESTGIHGWAIKFFYENMDKDTFQKDFESRFSIRRSTATNMLQLMENNGFIVRESVPYDARLKKIILTPKAIDIHQKIESNIAYFEEQMSQGISKEEMDTFYRVLDKIKTNLENIDSDESNLTGGNRK